MAKKVLKTTRKRGPAKPRSHISLPSHVRLFSSHVLEASLMAAIGPPPLAAVETVRKNADALSPAEQQMFKDVVTEAIADGIYSQLVWIHSDMTHDMHTMKGMPAGTQRFLPWHRVYLVKFEQAMRAFDPSFSVPYWRWMDATSIPSWMTSFKPSGVVNANGKPIAITRAPGTDPNNRNLPTSKTIQNTVMNNHDYIPFTLALEGAKPYGGHNLVHMWLHGTMSNVPIAPADPMFWMHHAEIDRLWAIWSNANPGKVPNLSGTSAVLDPWPETIPDVLDTTKIPEYPYICDRMTL